MTDTSYNIIDNIKLKGIDLQEVRSIVITKDSEKIVIATGQ